MCGRGSVRFIGVLSGLFSVVWLGSIVSCGGSGADEPPAPSTPAAPVSTASGGSGSAPQPSPSPPAPGVPTNGETPTPAANLPIVPNETDQDPADVDGAAAVDACSALGAADACGACVCTECRSELDACLGVEGCAEILACVRQSGCSGRDCYCGDASLTECVRGEANGPCQEAVLAAPGGKAPSLSDPSGGPASDAALSVSDCADDDETCQDVCALGD